MHFGRGLAWLTIVTIGATVFVSSPLIAGVDLTHPPSGPTENFGEGTANVSIQTVPETVVLKRSSFGAQTYRFSQEDTEVSVLSVSGNPYIEYRIEIPALDVVHIRAQKLNDNTPNREVLRFDAYEIRPERIENETYRGRLEIHLQSDNYELLHSSNVTVRVKG